ncbi:MAG: extracellular solute-binding protein [Endozoicomonas sp.]
MKQPVFPAIATVLLCLLFLDVQASESEAVNSVRARALHGTPHYPEGFKHFDYVNPSAPKQGKLRLGLHGTFDTFNPFASKGIAAPVTEYLYDTLMVKSRDEPYSVYGLIAEQMEYPADNSWVAFKINPRARFSDGEAITARDVAFSFEQLTSRNLPIYKSLFSGVDRVTVDSRHRVVFHISERENHELPFRLAQLPILPAHSRDTYNYGKADLTYPTGSGQYRIKSYETGKKVALTRIDDYWARDLPVNKGRYNFHEIQFEFFRNATISLQAFLAGNYDIRIENLAKNWAVGYKGSEVDAGVITRVEYPRKSSQVQSFIFNTRKPQFRSRKVREAISQAYDFQWTNHKLLFDNYAQPASLFAQSSLGQRGKPSQAERALLEPFRKTLPPELFTGPWLPVTTNGDGNIRSQLAYAAQLLKEGGWVRKDQQLIHRDSGDSLSFELLLLTPEQERIAAPFRKNLQQLGVQMQIKTIDPSQYVQRIREFDYDMLLRTIVQSDAPGNEQKQYWGSRGSMEKGSQNLAGVNHPAVDSLVEKIVAARSREQLVIATRALDRVLLWEHYTIPQLYMPYWRIAYRSNFAHPEKKPLYGAPDLSIWWEVASTPSACK